ncbi:MAG: hypothetical protein ACP5JF_05995 [Candidatus Methanodesulfokora sp.]
MPGTVKFKFYLTAREVIGSKELLLQVDEMKLNRAMELLRKKLGGKSICYIRQRWKIKALLHRSSEWEGCQVHGD